MKRVEMNRDDSFRIFLPHHAVIRESSNTIKTRIIFNACSQYVKGKSLNDALYNHNAIRLVVFLNNIISMLQVRVMC